MRVITIMATSVLFIQIGALSVSAQSITKNFARFYSSLYKDHEMNGNVAVAVNERTVYQQTFGLSDEANQRPNKEQTQFELASISKLFTATAILQLKDRGLLGLDTPFVHYFPEFPYPDITVRHLLAHTSGLPDIESVVDPLLPVNPDKQFTIHNDLQNVLLYSRTHKLKFLPGEQWSYSSLGYHLLGLLIEKLSAQTLANYTQDHIFKVAGMKHSYVQSAMAQKAEPNRAKNYQYNNHFEMKLQWMDTLSDWHEWTYNLALETGGSGVISTTGDMLRFNKALNSGILIKQKTFEEACSPYHLNNGQPAQPFDLTYCGLGWFIFKDTSCGKIIWGSGANPGTISFFASNINKNQCMVVLHNIKSNPFNDLKTLDMLCGKAVSYHSSLAFIYAHNLYKNGKVYADTQLQKLYTDTANYIMIESELNRVALEFRRAGLKSQALAVTETHIRLFPKSAGAFKDYALTLAEYGQKEQAIVAYQKALELDPNDRESHDALNKLTDKTKP